MLAGVIVVSAMAWLTARARAVDERNAAAARVSAEMKAKVSLAHLWLEEAITGDPDVDLATDVYANVDASLASCRQMLEGRHGESATVFPMDGEAALADLGGLCRQLRLFRDMTEERWRNRATTAPGSGIEGAYDQVFRGIVAAVDRDAAFMQERIDRNRRLERQLAVATTGGLVALFGGMLAVVRRHRRVVEAKNTELEGLAAIVASSDDAIVSTTLEGVVLSWNAGAERLYGYTAAETVGRPVGITVPPERRHEVAQNLERIGMGQRVVQQETTRVDRDGRTVEVSLTISPVRGPDGRVCAAASIARDVTERNEAQRALAHQAFYDSLTDLANRALFRERLGRAVSGAGHGGEEPAVLVVDLDAFKEVNDTLGHAAGDRLLVEVANRLQACVGPDDTAARIGGDQFALVLAAAGKPGAERAADSIVTACRRPVVLEGRTLLPYASIGIAVWEPGRTADDLVRNADAAMYAAKAAGGNQRQVHDQAVHAGMLARLELASDLRGAVERGEFTLYYQPIVATGSARIVGTEALVRWNHPRRGLVSPQEFIPLAEETGAIGDLGRWVLETACHQAIRWQGAHQDEPPPYVSVNVAARQLRDDGLAADVERVLTSCGLPPESLVLEITETSLVSDFEAAIGTLHELKALGVKLSIDDFGTGYSSLAYLRRLPVDVVKIDRSFVRGIASAPDEWALAVAVIRLVKSLSLQTVAEGVESAAQVAHLRALGCDFAQGYYFARPQDAAAVGALLAERAAASSPGVSAGR